MARITCGRQADELPRSRILVAIFALYENMCSNEWKSILVVLNRLQRNLPSLDRVAVGAIGPELTAMNVGVTVRTLRTYVLENQAGMALGTAYVLMHTAERVSGLIVIEFGIRPDRFPTGVRVTICARDGKRSMGIRHLGLGNAYTRFYARTSAGITGRFAARIIRGPAAWVAAGIGLLCDSKGFAQNNNTSGWRQRNATEHGRQPERNGRETASKVHRSLRATVCTRRPTRSADGKAQKPRKPASHARRQLQTALSANDEPYRGSKNKNFGILVCPDFHTQPMKQTPSVGRFGAFTLTAARSGAFLG